MIEIRIDRGTLNIKIEAHNYKGSSCIRDLDKICNILKARVIDKKDKKEMYSNIKIIRGGYVHE